MSKSKNGYFRGRCSRKSFQNLNVRNGGSKMAKTCAIFRKHVRKSENQIVG